VIVYQLLAQGRWFSPGTPASSTTKTDRHDIAEILQEVELNRWRKPEYPERTTDPGQATGKLSLVTASRVHPFFVIYKAGRDPTPYW
jgi:hypothetical protein